MTTFMAASERSLDGGSAVAFATLMGAEARIEPFSWFGKKAVKKTRVPKAYRNADLDRILRTRRTKEELEILHNAKLAGVNCPEIFFADPNESSIIMEYIEGTLLRDLQVRGRERDAVFTTLGSYAAKMHGKSIIHGDLTTKNVIVSANRVALIDFGLSFVSDRVEDKAEDLHLLKQALKSSEPTRTAARDFQAALSGYSQEAGRAPADQLRRQIAKIELRGRYARVE